MDHSNLWHALMPPPPSALLRIRWCRFTSAALTRPVLKPDLEYATSFLPSLLSWRVPMPDALLALALLLALGAAVELCIKVAFVRLLPLLLRLPFSQKGNL
jgi:hypothetical protein